MARFRVVQDGMVVAGAEGTGAEDIANHYALIYSQDSDVWIQRYSSGRWKDVAKVKKIVYSEDATANV